MVLHFGTILLDARGVQHRRPFSLYLRRVLCGTARKFYCLQAMHETDLHFGRLEAEACMKIPQWHAPKSSRAQQSG